MGWSCFEKNLKRQGRELRWLAFLEQDLRFFAFYPSETPFSFFRQKKRRSSGAGQLAPCKLFQ